MTEEAGGDTSGPRAPCRAAAGRPPIQTHASASNRMMRARVSLVPAVSISSRARRLLRQSARVGRGGPLRGRLTRRRVFRVFRYEARPALGLQTITHRQRKVPAVCRAARLGSDFREEGTPRLLVLAVNVNQVHAGKVFG